MGLAQIDFFESSVVTIKHKIGHIINVLSFVMCPIFFVFNYFGIKLSSFFHQICPQDLFLDEAHYYMPPDLRESIHSDLT